MPKMEPNPYPTCLAMKATGIIKVYFKFFSLFAILAEKYRLDKRYNKNTKRNSRKKKDEKTLRNPTSNNPETKIREI
jgi:hypothetical protein